MFKKLTLDAILPKRQTRFYAGFDVFANEDKVIAAGQTELIGLGIAIDLEQIKLSIANNLLKKCIEDDSNIDKGSWIYTDFVKEDRFMYEIKDEDNIDIKSSTFHDIVRFVCKKIGVQYAKYFEFSFSFDEFLATHYFALHIRSSLRAKGLTSLGTGVIDIDYSEEIKMVVHNPVTLEGYSIDDGYRLCVPTSCDYSYKINKGDKIGQLILKRHEGYLLPQEYTLDNERVSGFGHSGAR